MGRQPQPEIRARLLAACVEHALAHGLPDRLEPLATATGTSARMLLYHFGTRDGLLRAVLVQARAQQLELFRGLLEPRPDEPYTATLRRAWAGMTGPAGAPYLRVFGRLRESAEQQLWPDFRRVATTDWLGTLGRGTATLDPPTLGPPALDPPALDPRALDPPALGRPELATLVLAVVRGLFMDLDATGDTARADRAFDDFLALLGG